MDLRSDLDDIKQDVKPDDTQIPQDKQSSDVKALQEIKPEVKQEIQTFEDAKNKALEGFKPVYNQDKSIYENGKDIARTIGLSEALKDNGFMDEVKEGAKKNIRTDIDTDQKDSEAKNQQAFYKKHKPVLMFAKLKEPCDIRLMVTIFIIAIIPFVISSIIGEIFNIIGKFFEAINELFNAIIGIPEYVLDKDGQPVKDSQGNFVIKSVRVNLLTKIIFWAAFSVLSVVIILAIIKGIFGFDVVQAIRNLISG